MDTMGYGHKKYRPPISPTSFYQHDLYSRHTTLRPQVCITYLRITKKINRKNVSSLKQRIHNTNSTVGAIIIARSCGSSILRHWIEIQYRSTGELSFIHSFIDNSFAVPICTDCNIGSQSFAVAISIINLSH